jgi:hypothetical protein
VSLAVRWIALIVSFKRGDIAIEQSRDFCVPVDRSVEQRLDYCQLPVEHDDVVSQLGAGAIVEAFEFLDLAGVRLSSNLLIRIQGVVRAWLAVDPRRQRQMLSANIYCDRRHGYGATRDLPNS